jgi:LAS superfamily LD-carboxypeptidase LdcB
MGINIKRVIFIFVILLVVSGFTYGAFFYFDSIEKNRSLMSEISLSEQSLVHIKELFLRAKVENIDLTDLLNNEKTVNSNLSNNLQTEQAKNTMFESQIRSISGVVGTLQKLSQTDKELLKKYSKIYFLSENYIPSKLSRIDGQYLLNSDGELYFHGDVIPFLSVMMSDAKNAGVNLKIVSAYRSFDDQISVKTGYKVLYGSGANQFSADQGYSEHQLGTTVDFTTPTIKRLVKDFENKPEYKWLTENAYKYGFILSYPKGNSYYQYEPWHWRFVGIALAKKLFDEKKSFYNLTQREIDVYLVSIFDR